MQRLCHCLKLTFSKKLSLEPRMTPASARHRIICVRFQLFCSAAAKKKSTFPQVNKSFILEDHFQTYWQTTGLLSSMHPHKAIKMKTPRNVKVIILVIIIFSYFSNFRYTGNMQVVAQGYEKFWYLNKILGIGKSRPI